MGVFARALSWCIWEMAFTTLISVVSFDIYASPTLEVHALATIGNAFFSIILVSCSKILMCCILSAYTILI